MSKETTTEYSLELRLVTIEVNSDSYEFFKEYEEVESEIELLKCSENYDDMLELFNDYRKQLA